MNAPLQTPMNSSDIHSLAGASVPSQTEPTTKQLLTGLAMGGGVGAALCFLGFSREWYSVLVKPVWAPPLWVLSLLQLLAFAFMGASLAHLWAARAPLARKKVVLSWFWTQLVLGILWNGFFFGLHWIGWGYAVIMVWWCIVAALLWTGSKVSRAAFFALLPLAVWVTFASSLTFSMLSFNILRQSSAQMDSDPRNRNSPAEPPIIIKKR